MNTMRNMHNMRIHPTVACIIVRRLLISVHKWQFSGMADTHEYWSQHDAHLVYSPIFHGLNLIMQNSKFTEIFTFVENVSLLNSVEVANLNKC